ncbi:hypothetical protein [uncultured Ruthenibacterium sp.]|uniref:hypothetical protein n=1 Tax=uncultured Ruthenibacterium sp. TaxID=1905347 RepID=UPI00349E4EF1
MFWYEIVFWVLMLLHLLCCALIYIGIRAGVLKVRRLMALVALLVPFWGEVLVLVLHFQILFKQTDRSEVGVEKFQVDSELYKGIQRDESRVSGSTVSMEEALIVNTPKERRALIMDILNDNPKAYVEFLKMAGNNDDTEVVHYAVTAMVQIAKENDQTLWELEQKYTQNPDDPELLTAYCEFLWRCLEQGLMQGQVERMNRNLFDVLIQKKMGLGPAVAEDYLRCIRNNMELKNYTAAASCMEKAMRFWPRNEEFLIEKIQYLADLERGEELQALLHRLEEKDLYLTAKVKEVIAFWKD